MDNAPMIALGGVAVFAVFFFLRVLMLWYWRINDAIALLTSIDQKLGLLDQQKPLVATSRTVIDK